MWLARTLEMFKFIREYHRQLLLAFGNSILIVGIPESLYWVADNDNEAKQ